MSRIDDLIAEKCPDGVEHKPLGDVGAFVRGSGLQKKDFVEDGFPCIHYGQIYTYYGTSTTTTRSFVTPDLARTLRKARSGDLVVTTTSENIEDVGKAVVWLGDGEVAYGGHACSFSHSLDPLYAAYLLQTHAFNRQKGRHVKGTKVKEIAGHELARIVVPVPPIEIQREIAEVLSKMDQLGADLKAELEARRAQRLALANNFEVALRDGTLAESQTRLVTLDSFAKECVAPVAVEPEREYLSLGVKWNGEGVLTRKPRDGASIKASTLYRVRPGQLIYNRMFVVEGSLALVPEHCEGAVVSAEFPVFELDTAQVDPFWLLQHLCAAHTLGRIEREVTGTERGSMKSRRRWKASQFTNFEVLLPSLEKQREIGGVLKKSDGLIRVIEAEISARRKQHGHYRDRLLTFRELAARSTSSDVAGKS